jgi:glycine/D-amino acid oxidase-like deaminating enzyme
LQDFLFFFFQLIDEIDGRIGVFVGLVYDSSQLIFVQNGGHCQPQIYTNPNHIARFELDNFLNIRSLITDNKIECDWRNVDSCHGYCNASMFAAAVSAVDVLRSTDPELADMITIVTPQSTTPSFSDLRLGGKVIGAITQRNSASLWPYKLVAWILERLLSRSYAKTASSSKNKFSFNLQTNTPVTRLQQLEDGTWVVHTSRGMLAAKQVLLATNAYTSYLLPEFSDLIVSVKGEMSALIPPQALCPGGGGALVGQNSYGFYGRGGGNFNQDDYLVQRPFSATSATDNRGGELLFGGGREYAAGLGVGISDDSDIDQLVADYLRQALNNLLDIQNNGTDLRASHEWSGIMGFSRDGRPWVGEVPKELGGGKGLWMCAGFTGHGMPNASLCAKAVVNEMMGQQLHDKDLPKEFHVSLERVEMARTFVEVSLADILEDEVQ